MIQNDLNYFNLSKELIKLKNVDYTESIKNDYLKLLKSALEQMFQKYCEKYVKNYRNILNNLFIIL